LKYSNVIIVVLLKVLIRHNIHIQEQQRQTVIHLTSFTALSPYSELCFNETA